MVQHVARRSALFRVLQYDPAVAIIDNSPLLDLLQGPKAAEADQVVVETAIADARGLSGVVSVTHGASRSSRLRI